MCDRIGGSQRVKLVVVFQLLRTNPEQCQKRSTTVASGAIRMAKQAPDPTRRSSVFSTIRRNPR